MGEELATRHDLPNGTTVWYYDEKHHYCSRSQEEHTNPSGTCWNNCPTRIPGTSTIAANDGNTSPDGGMYWADSLARKGKNWQEERDAKGEIGNGAHKVLEALTEDVMPPLHNGYEQAVVDWWKKRRPEVLQSEATVYSTEHNYAGRFDLRCRPTTGGKHPNAVEAVTNKIILLDAKASNKIKAQHHIQLAGYDLAAIECGIGPSEGLVLLHLYDDGSWNEWESGASHLDFLTALSTYEMGKRLSRIQTAQESERKKLQKASEQLAQAA